MERFTYARAESIQHAVALLNEPGVRARPLAGGTDLLLLMREEPDLCDRVVDISLVPALRRIQQDGNRITIGAAASFTDVMESPVVQATAPILARACAEVGAVQIRNMGTLGGNVANAAACADSLPALVCLDATATIVTPDREMTMPVDELIVRPNRTRIPAGGLLASLSYQVPLPGSRGAFRKLGRRNAMAISRLTVAALGRIDANGRIAEARLVPGAATPQIRRFRDVEAMLLGHTPTTALMAEAGKAAAAEMLRITGVRWSSEFKELALAAMVEDALGEVFQVRPNLGVKAS